MELNEANSSASTGVGSYFVANYPPFSAWNSGQTPRVLEMMGESAKAEHGAAPPLGLYMHIPFCRKRCKFCYFRVYTDKNSSDVETYLSALGRELELYAQQPRFKDRELRFVYFGGGTPSFLSNAQLVRLVEGVASSWNWDRAAEVTFECEPGTLKKSKLETIKAIGTTRLSLGIEHFDDHVLELNGRAHRSPEVFQAYQWAREVGFAQINVDLIAGMLGDTDELWTMAVKKALELEPDSITIYQMELPCNTIIAREAGSSGGATGIASWDTKRRWVDEAFQTFQQAGYVVSSAYTLVKPSNNAGFVYRDSLWHGADMLGSGVASFSHVGGVHFQNADTWEGYVDSLNRGELPIDRALVLSPDQRLIREFILQLKLGTLDLGYFKKKFDVDVRERFADAIDQGVQEGSISIDGDRLELSREALLRVDELLPRFFEPEFREVRYT